MGPRLIFKFGENIRGIQGMVSLDNKRNIHLGSGNNEMRLYKTQLYDPSYVCCSNSQKAEF